MFVIDGALIASRKLGDDEYTQMIWEQSETMGFAVDMYRLL